MLPKAHEVSNFVSVFQRRRLFVIVMAIGGKHIHIDLGLEYFVDQSVFLRDSAAPLSGAVALQLLGMARAGTWV